MATDDSTTCAEAIFKKITAITQMIIFNQGKVYYCETVTYLSQNSTYLRWISVGE